MTLAQALVTEQDDAMEAGVVRPTGKDRPHIVVVLPRGEAIRNFVHTGALDLLSQSAAVTLLTVLPRPDFQELCEGRFARVVELRDVEERWIVRIHRDMLDLAHGRWLWSAAARERWRLRDREATTAGSKLKRAAKKIACYPFATRPGLAVLSAAERQASRWFRTTDEYLDLFRELKPSLVFNGSHVHAGAAVQAVQAAQWLGIPTAAFLFSWDNLTSQGRIVPPYDHYLVWNKDIHDQVLRIYPFVRPDQISITGTPQFDFHFRPEFHWTRDEFCRRIGADPARPIVLYTTGMANHMPGEPKIVEDIAASLRAMTDLGPPQLVVRVYAKDMTGRFDALKGACPDVLFPPSAWDAWLTPTPEDCVLYTNMLRHAAVGVNVASTVSLELGMFDTPVVNVAYNPPGVDREEVEYANYYTFDHYRPLVERGAVTLARSPEEMRGLLRKAISERESVATRGRAFVASMLGDTLDGEASRRVADTLLQLTTMHGARS